MKVIFLDIDGVLNCNYSISRCQGFLGIDKCRVKLLRHIVNQTTSVDNPTKIVLTSTWKLHWDTYMTGTPQYADKVGKYMREKFRDCGLEIYDWTKETEPLSGAGLRDRGRGINKWLTQHPEVTNWVVLDDEVFPDYYHYNIMDNLILTDAKVGLENVDCSKAIHILNNSKKILQDEKGLSYLPCMSDFKKFIKNPETMNMMKNAENDKDFYRIFDLFIERVRHGEI